jgi:mevalonate kinase
LSRSYPAKLLLFGEYTVLNGSQALAVPLSVWSGHWTRAEVHQPETLLAFIAWLRDKAIITEHTGKKMLEEIDNGLTFSSDIPMGFGVGSSGALVAAVYDRYLDGNQEDASIIMANMESFFHGTSSGMDPLVSRENKAVLKDEKGVFHVIRDPGWPEGYKIYLWNSGISRETGPLVNHYKIMLQQDAIRFEVERNLIPMTDHAIHFYLSGESTMLEQCISMISQFQRKYMAEWIMPDAQQVWDSVSGQRGVYMKLCGAGGGGYYLVISAQGEEINLPGIVQIS